MTTDSRHEAEATGPRRQRRLADLSTTTAGRVVGGLILSGFFLYGGGSYLLASTADGATPLPENAASLWRLCAGAGLMLLNSAAVTTVGVLAFHVLRRRHRRTASTYLLTRVLEGTLLALLPAGILTLVLLNQGRSTRSRDGEAWLTGLARATVDNGDSTYWVAMAILGVGSLAFCRALLRSGLLPRLLAMGGIVGYAVFALGSVLQLSGYHVGLALSLPGGLFEIVAGSYLLVKGFPQIPTVLGADPAAERTDPAQLAGSNRPTGLPITIRELVPRRVKGLPPGQRHVRAFPRFSDNPLSSAPPIEPIALTVSVDGAPIRTFSADDLARLEQVDQVSDFHCVTTWTYRGARWGGVRFSELAATVFDGATPRYLAAHAADRRSAIYLTEDLDDDNVLLATRLDDRPLDRRHGAPLRLVSPDQYGYKNIKHLVGLDFRHEEPSSTLGPKEHLRARVAAEERHSTLPNWAVKAPYRLLIIPTALAAERSLRSSPR